MHPQLFHQHEYDMGETGTGAIPVRRAKSDSLRQLSLATQNHAVSTRPENNSHPSSPSPLSWHPVSSSCLPPQPPGWRRVYQTRGPPTPAALSAPAAGLSPPPHPSHASSAAVHWPASCAPSVSVPALLGTCGKGKVSTVAGTCKYHRWPVFLALWAPVHRPSDTGGRTRYILFTVPMRSQLLSLACSDQLLFMQSDTYGRGENYTFMLSLQYKGLFQKADTVTLNNKIRTSIYAQANKHTHNIHARTLQRRKITE